MPARRQPAARASLDQLLVGLLDAAAASIPAVPVAGLASDSREVLAGGVFVALAGASRHGLDFLDAVLAAAPLAVLADAADARFDSACRARIATAGALPVAVPGLAAALGEIAARFYTRPGAALAPIGVTGTDGKTSVSQFIAAALDAPGRRCGVIGTLGNGFPGALAASDFTTPDAIGLQAALADLRAAGARRVAMEVSSHGLALQRVAAVPFEIAVLTNLGRDHLDFHGSLDAYRAAKAALFDWPGLRCRVLNLDDDFGRELAAAARPGVRDIGYSASAAAGAEFAAADIDCADSGLRFTLRTPRGCQPVATRLLGHFNVDNLLASAAALSACGLDDADIAARLSALQPVAGRLERFSAAGRPTAVVDYAHTPQALAAALAALRPHCSGALWCLFGCGGERDRGKRAEMAAAAEAGADCVVVCDDNPRGENPQRIIDDIRAGFARPQAVRVQRDRAAAIAESLAAAAADDWLLVAGKGHEDYQIVAGERRHYSDRETLLALLDPDGRGGGA